MATELLLLWGAEVAEGDEDADGVVVAAAAPVVDTEVAVDDLLLDVVLGPYGMVVTGVVAALILNVDVVFVQQSYALPQQ